MIQAALLLAAAWLLGGCSSSAVRLMPTPALFTSGDPGLIEAGADAERDTTIKVLYATNRLPEGPPDSRRYTRTRSDQLRLGVATLRVGDGTKTWEALSALSTSVVEGERPEITLQATRDLLIYMHGANTDFDRAAAQAAQFQHFLGRDAVVMVFAWPSAGSPLRYGRDVATARRSVPAFARLLELLSAHTRGSHVNVLAYSAGALIASPGLARAAGEVVTSADPDRLRLGEIYYAAPDIDFPVFVDNLPRYQRVSSGRQELDVLLKLRFHAPPPARGLEPNSNQIELAFWTFPSDYAERLPAIVRALSNGRNT